MLSFLAIKAGLPVFLRKLTNGTLCSSRIAAISLLVCSRSPSMLNIRLVIIINPRRACAARVTCLSVCLSVCQSVCLSVCLSVRRLANLAVQGTGRPMTATNRFRVARSLILIGRFPETTGFERYGVKTS